MEYTEANKQAARKAIRIIAKTFNVDIPEIILCNVDAVSDDKRTCDVTPISGKSSTQITEVSLNAEKNDGEYKIPKVNSTVGVLHSSLVDPVVVSWSDLQEWYIIIGTTVVDMISGTIKLGSFQATEAGVLGNTLATLLSDLIDAIKAMTVTTGTGPSGTPINTAAFESIQDRIDSIKSEIVKLK